MKLYIMRHGETDGNKSKILQGRLDNPLNEAGREQAKSAGEKLADISFDACFVSPLTRAIQTAEIATGWDRSRMIKDDRIVEISFGSMEGRTLEDLGMEALKFFLEPANYKAPEDAETFEELIARVSEFLEDMKKQPYENMLVVSHGAAIHAMLLVLRQCPLEQFWRLDVGNCGVTEVTLTGNEWKITKECETRDLHYGKGILE